MKLDIAELRSRYISYFVANKHVVVPSAPLVPENDATTLFINSGMQPLLPYFLGTPHPVGSRVVNSQKCFRSQDIEDVGDNRHTTFFEMLGNWSFGDYFKDQQITWVFDFLTNSLNLDPKRLYVTVFSGSSELGIPLDTESIALWQREFKQHAIDSTVVTNPEQAGWQAGRIFHYQWQNWWSRVGKPSAMPEGEPGGPDSEVFYDFGEEHRLHEQSPFRDQPCHPNCDCGRFMEICNSVFMQYVKKEDGNFEELPKKNVDFGGGLERLLAANHNQPDFFRLPLFTPIIQHLEKLSGKKYAQHQSETKAFRVISDHVRALVFLLADGVMPSNKDRGYVARRLLRRAVRFSHSLGIQDVFLAQLAPIVSGMYAEYYPNLKTQLEQIQTVLSQEELKFRKTLVKGEIELQKILSKKASKNQSNLTPADAFYVYESFGFPVELTQEIVSETYGEDSQINSEEFMTDFLALKQSHADSSRTSSAGRFKGGLQDTSIITTRYHTATHLLHAALRKVLGDQIFQRGSHITDQRLRFDYSCAVAVSDEQLAQVLQTIQHWIDQKLPVTRQELSKSQALEQGAMALFAEKYPDQVSVYTIGKDPNTDWISKELCGGPHVANTEEIGSLQILKDQSIGSGVRRMYLQFVE